ncbi:OFA family MFS transporter [Leuconostocaceae bacterium ESL0958]|nr:OFA family MFS transporter [Leuconostocaceae bacterium ESL0958]
MNNKWLRAALPALLIHSCIGTVYAWSVFKAPVARAIGAAPSSLEWAFSLAILFLGLSAALLGPFVERNIRRSALLATGLFSLGMLGTALSIQQKSLIGIDVFYGPVMGIGLGIGYLTPIKNLMLWFHDQKGLGTGLAVAGFGLAKMIFAPIMLALERSVGLWQMFALLTVVFAIMLTIGSLLLQKPANWTEQPLQSPFRPLVLFQKRNFLGIWLMFYLNITAGLAIISQEKDILSAIRTPDRGPAFTVGMIATVLSIDAFCNAAGRIGFASLSDRLKDRNSVYQLIFASSLFVSLFALATSMTSFWAPAILMMTFFCINAGYGGGFSALAPLLSDRFGMQAISKIHGLALTAWAAAGLSGNQLASFLVQVCGFSYRAVFLVIACLYLLALFIARFWVNDQQDIIA